MIAGCPKCSARYRVDAERIGPDGAKLRCTKCSAVFLVRAPQARERVTTSAPAEPPAAPVTSTSPAAAASPPGPSGPQSAAASAGRSAPTESADPSLQPVSEADRPRLVIVADPDEERGKESAEAIAGWGLIPHLVHDGVEAMLAIQRMLPAAVVLDAALPKMFGFQVCEVIKRNESLRATTVVLVGAIHQQDRYRRGPSELYGADVYIEPPDLPDGLLPILREGGLPIESDSRPAFDAPPPPEPDLRAEAPRDLPGAEDPAVEDPARAEERERAERLARIAVSEMLLYQPEKFDQAAKDGTLEQVLDMEISEARALLRQRISEEVRGETDFILDELQRVAKERSGQG